MPIIELTAEQTADLVDTRHAGTGMLYPPDGLQPYYLWLMRSLHQLAETSASALKIHADADNPAGVIVMPGRASINGHPLNLSEQAIDLSEFDDDTLNVWLHRDSGSAAVSVGTSGDGWPSTPHIRLAQVVLDEGAVTSIIDRRFEAILRAHRIAAADAAPTIVDHSGGTAGGTPTARDVGAVSDVASAADAIATLAAHAAALSADLDALKAALRDAGLMASA